MKVMVHAHTTFSGDGELTPQELAQLARKRGFDAVMVSDHFESLKESTFQKLVAECSRVSECLMVPGYERSFRGYHVLALGIDKWIDDRNVQCWADAVRSAGGIVVAAHPSRYNHAIPSDILEACDGVEVWNSKFFYDGEVGPNPRSFPLLGKSRQPFCSQDLHGVRHASPVGMLFQRQLSTGREIITAVRGGEYRMTNGVLTFDTGLAGRSQTLLRTFHTARRRAVSGAVELRRWIRRTRKHD